MKIVDRMRELLQQPKIEWHTSDWTRNTYSPPPLDTQVDGWSCGLFVLMALGVVSNAEATFEKAGDGYKDGFRRKAVQALLSVPSVTNTYDPAA